MAKKLPDSDTLFATLCKFWPVVGDRCIQFEHPAAVGDSHGGRSHSFGDGESQSQCVVLPRLRRATMTAPQVNDLSSLVINGTGRALLTAYEKILLKLLTDGMKLWLNGSGNWQ